MQKNFTKLLARAITARLHLNASAGVLLLILMLIGNTVSAQVVDSIDPTCKTAGEGEFTLRINGSGFNGNPTVKLDGTTVSRSINSAQTVITVQVPASYIKNAGELTITVEKGNVLITRVLTVAPVTNAGIITASQNNFCAGTQGVTYSVAAVPGASGYTWTVPAGATIASGQNSNQITVNYSNTASSGNVTVAARNACDRAGTTSSIAVTVNAIPAAPAAQNAERCGPGTVTLAVTNPNSNLTYHWYTASGVVAGTGTSFTPSLNSSTTYYLAAVGAGNCESGTRTPVTAEIKPLPVATITAEAPQCDNPGASNVFGLDGKAENGTYAWEIVSGGNIATIDGTNTLTPNVTVTSPGTVTVSLTVTSTATGCEPAVEEIDLVVDPLPEAVASTNLQGAERCGPGIVTLSVIEPAANTTYKWYAAAAGGVSLHTGNSYTTDALSSSKVYYVAAVNSAGCESDPRTPVTATVKPLPVASIAAETPQCENTDGATLFELTGAVGNGTYAWEVVEGGTIATLLNENTTTPTVSVSEAGTVRVRLTVTSNSECGVVFDEVDLIVNPVPDALTEDNVENVTRCGPGSVTLVASGAPEGVSYRWYTAATGGDPAFTGASFTTPVLQSSKTYYVAAFIPAAGATGCESDDRIPVTATIEAVPEANISVETPQCEIPGGQNVFALTGIPVNYTSFTWAIVSGDDIATISGEQTLTPQVTVEGPGTVRVQFTVSNESNSCPPDVETIDLVVEPLPAALAQENVTGAERCGPGEVTLSATGAPANGSYRWYTQESGGQIQDSDASFTVTVNKTTTFYVAAVNSAGCESIERVAVIATVNDIPVISAGANQAVCSQGTTTSFTLAGTADASTAKWEVINGTATIADDEDLNTVVTVSGTTATLRLSVSNTNCEATDEVVLTVNPLPTASAGADQAKCVTGTSTSFTLAGAATNGTGTWTVLSSTGNATAAIANPSSLTSGVAVGGTGTVTLRLTTASTTSPACGTATDEVVLTVNSLPTANAGTYPAQCVGDNNKTVFNLTNGSVTNGTPTWAFVSGTNGATATITGANTMSPQVTVTGTGTGTVTIRLTASSDQTPACTPAATSETTLTVNPLPTVSAGTTQTGCQAIVNGLPAPTTFTLNGTSNVSNVTWSVFTQPATVSNVSFSNINSLTSNVTIMGYGSVVLRLTATGVGSCVNTSNVTINVSQRKKLTLVLEADPFPVCPGTNTRYKATVYEDAVVVWNVDRRDSVDVVSFGRDVSDQFTFDWWKNDEVDNQQGQTGRVVAQAGLSSTDYYTVRATLKSGSTLTCNYFEKTFSTGLTGADLYSNRIYLGYPEGYGVNVSADPGNVICAGTSVKFTATANATYANPVWQWQVNGNNVQGETSSTFTTSTLKNEDVVRVLFGSAESICGLQPVSNEIIMTVNALPAITTQPATPRAICAGQTVKLSVGAIGTGITYQWYKRASDSPTSAGSPVTNGGRVSGATSSVLNISNTVASDAGLYYVVVSGTCAPAATSNNTELYITPIPTAYSVEGGGAYCANGGGVEVRLADSEVGVRYQLLLNGSNVSGAVVDGTGEAISFDNRTAAGTYTVKATSVSGTTTVACPREMTGSAVVTVNPLPVAQTVTTPSGTNYCAGSTGITVGLAGSQSGVVYTLRNSADAPVATVNGTGSAVTFPGNIPAGTYTVMANNTTTTCSSTFGSITISETALPTLYSITGGGSYCERGGFGVPVGLSDSDQGVSYQLQRTVDGATSNVGTAVAGTGNAVDFGNQLVGGIYTVVATTVAGPTTTTCPREMTGSAQVTVNSPVVADGEILVSNSAGPITDANPIMPGSSITITTEDDITDAGVAKLYTWYIGNDAEGIWGDPVTTTTNELIIDDVKPGEFDVKVEISPNNNGANCFEDLLLVTENPLVPLPVEIIYLNASRQGNNVVLEWATAMEEDNTGFEVQVSTDGFNYRLLAFVPARNGNSSTRQEYEFTDKENGKFGTRYYRLKQIDTNGTYEFFGPKAVTFGSVASKVIAFPNPFHDEVTLDIAAEVDGEALITVTDAVGKQLLERKVQVQKGFTTEKLRLDANLPKGLYIIKAQVGGITQYIKMIKE